MKVQKSLHHFAPLVLQIAYSIYSLYLSADFKGSLTNYAYQGGHQKATICQNKSSSYSADSNAI